MKIKSTVIRPFAQYIYGRVQNMAQNAVRDQESIRQKLVTQATKTQFGKDHAYADIQSYDDFTKHIPIRDYEGLKSYIQLIIEGQRDVLWPGKPKYFAKTSGTTSGVKYIPITKSSMPNHINSARNALMCYFAETGNATILDGKVMFLSGSPVLEKKGGIPTGRLSGIVNHEVPSWLQGNQVPSFETNCIEEWESKVEKVVHETKDIDLRLIGGIPPWVQMYYERLLEVTGKSTVSEVYKNLGVFVYGGVNYEPYRSKMRELMGKDIDTIEYYPASEGFFAYQINQGDDGLLLNTNSGIFYEFIPLSDFHSERPQRLSLKDVEVGIDYAIIINNNAGLWGYDIGDCVRFVSTNPYKLVVSGRVKHYISAFGEHVIGKEVDESMKRVSEKHRANVIEFTVAPQVNPPEGGLPYHEWWVAFDTPPEQMEAFASDLDMMMRGQNIYYDDLIDGGILQPLKVRILPSDAFRTYMKTQGKLGGQNKVPRLTNDRKIAKILETYV